MGLNKALIAEMRQEAVNTRKLLERVPFEQFGWKPHQKSMALGRLAVHVAELPGWTEMTVHTDGFDLATMKYDPYQPKDTADLLRVFDEHLEKAAVALESATDEKLMEIWTLRRGSHVMFELPKLAVIRSMSFSHLYHHRGQLSVYLRLLDVSIPGMYGPSADDMEMRATEAIAAAN